MGRVSLAWRVSLCRVRIRRCAQAPGIAVRQRVGPPARIPQQYWRHRIRMAKAMGMNTVSLYVMWNYLEEREGVFDFRTGRRNVEAFVRLCQAEGMWVLLRPGPPKGRSPCVSASRRMPVRLVSLVSA